ncbi:MULTISPECIES: hypothetical protein [unclassified Nocardioides]|uniref:hypothetical protein n=1 Tax=unclassified Nocardioides TaxID=2615069 RepID=UPI000A44FBB5|nr:MULTISPECIES: hypothetical protein [unclassified Nocardioides]
MHYTLSAFKRAGFVGGGRLLWLDTSDDWATARDALADVLAHEIWPLLGELEDDHKLYLQIAEPVPGPRGPLAVVDECEPAKALTHLLEVLAAGLYQRGVSGTLRPAKDESHPYFDNRSKPALSAMFVLPIDVEAYFTSMPYEGGVPREGWWVEATATREALAPIVDWVIQGGTDYWMTIDSAQFHIDPTTALDMLCSTLGHGKSNRLRFRATSGDTALRQLHTQDTGLIIATEYERSVPREDQLSDVRGLLEAVGPLASVSFVKGLSTMPNDRGDVFARFWPPAPMTANDRYARLGFRARHLLADHVFDAYVDQVLSTSQLEKTRLDRTHWTTADLGNGFHRVTHVDPTAWFAPTDDIGEALAWRMEPTILKQARSEFGQAIITPQLIFENPPPMPSGYFEAFCKTFNFDPDPSADNDH